MNQKKVKKIFSVVGIVSFVVFLAFFLILLDVFKSSPPQDDSKPNTAQNQTIVTPTQIPKENIPEMTLGRYKFVVGQKDTAKYSMNPMTKQGYFLVGKDARAVLYVDGVQYTINKKSKIHLGQIKELAVKVLCGALVIDSHIPGDTTGVGKNLPTPEELGLDE